MAVKLNLLPADYTLSGPLRQLVKASRSINVIFLSSFLITALGMGGFFIYSTISLNNLITANNKLTSQIQAQSQAQQQIVLLKDRLSQVKLAYETPSSAANFEGIIPLLDLIKDNSILSELDVDSQKTSASIAFGSNSGLTNFLTTASTSTNYSNVTLSTFNFSPVSGYQINMSFVGK